MLSFPPALRAYRWNCKVTEIVTGVSYSLSFPKHLVFELKWNQTATQRKSKNCNSVTVFNQNVNVVVAFCNCITDVENTSMQGFLQTTLIGVRAEICISIIWKGWITNIQKKKKNWKANPLYTKKQETISVWPGKETGRAMCSALSLSSYFEATELIQKFLLIFVGKQWEDK